LSYDGQPPATILDPAALKNGRGQIPQFGEELMTAMNRDRTEDNVKVMLNEERRSFVKRPPKPAQATALFQ
jgi:hypothetical protein